MNTKVATAALLVLMLGVIRPALTATTPAGIPLDAPWKVRVYRHGDCAALQARRILGGTGFPMEKIPAVQASFALAVKTLREYLRDIPPRLITKTAQRIGVERTNEIKSFLDGPQTESVSGKAM